MFKLFNFQKTHSGIYFEKNKIIAIKLGERDKNFYPIFWNILDFNFSSFKDKTEMVEFFKKIQKNLKTNKINFDQKGYSKDEEKEILSNLKIAGFEKINLVNWDFNIQNLILDKNIFEKTIFAFFETEEKIKLFYFKDKHIYKIQEINFSDLNKEIIEKIFEDILHRHIFISGYFENRLEEFEKIMRENEIKVHIFNLWTNILDFNLTLPALFKNESHKYIKAISLALPPQEEIAYIKEELKEKKKVKKESKKEEKKEELDLDFIADNKKEPEIISERHTFKQWLKNIFCKVLWGPKNAKSFRLWKDENKTKKEKKRKLFLPKPKKKLFLPKPKINLKLKLKKKIKKKEKKKNERIVFLPKPSLIINNKHSFKLVKIKKQETKKEKKNKKKKKVLLPKPKKKIFLPKPKNNWIKKFWKWLNGPVWDENKKEKKK